MIFHQQDAPPSGDLDQVQPALERHRQAGWIMERGLRVDQLDPSTLSLETVNGRFQFVEPESLVVHADADDRCLFAAHRPQRTSECGNLGDHDITRVQERRADRLDRSGCAVGQQIPVGARLRGVVAGEEARDLVAQRPVPLRSAVDQGSVARLLQHSRHGGEQLLPRLRFGVGDAATQRDRRQRAGSRPLRESPRRRVAGLHAPGRRVGRVQRREAVPGVARSVGGATANRCERLFWGNGMIGHAGLQRFHRDATAIRTQLTRGSRLSCRLAA